MPPARGTVRSRAAMAENDENAAPVRVTRAKAAAQGGPDELSAGLVRKALQSKKAGNNTISGAPTQRKRAALGDVSNVVKNDQGDGAKDGKKAAPARAALVSKAAQPAGVVKLSRSRSTLITKDANKKAAASDTKLKRPASGSGVMGGAQKKRSTGSAVSSTIKEDTPASDNDNGAVVKKAIKAEAAQLVIEKVETIKVDTAAPQLVVAQDIDEEIPDLDAEDLEDPLMVAEYAVEIFDYLREIEVSTQPNPDYMDHQDHIEWSDRDVLNDWLILVHQRFQLLPETFYLAINIVDRFLSNKIVQLDKLQLVGITAMFIASKYEEVISPHLSNFTWISKDYQDSEILSAERFILMALNYDLSYPNPMNFLRRISKADNYDIQTRTLGKYLLEISVLDHRFMDICPSHAAAASMYMSRLILERGEWDATLAHYAGYTEEEILPVFKLLLDYCSGEVKHEYFHNKYASKKYLKASLLVRQWAQSYVNKAATRPNSNFVAKDIKTR